jgi:hypothetical protein
MCWVISIKESLSPSVRGSVKVMIKLLNLSIVIYIYIFLTYPQKGNGGGFELMTPAL